MLYSRLLLTSLFLFLALPTIGSQIQRARAPNGYAPGTVDCPSPRPSIRSAVTLSPNETAWLEQRRNNTLPPLRAFLRQANISGFDTDSYLDNIANNVDFLPNFGIAISGGGYRALMNGAGALAAFDDRTESSTAVGQLGGVLQASTYLSGLSGGSWLVGSLYIHNFELPLGTIWQFDDSILEGPSTMRRAQYYQELFDAVNSKGEAGFNTTITDYWGRALSYQLVDANDGGPGDTFSLIAGNVDFAAARLPMPIIVAIERAPGDLVISANSTIFEFNPWEMGSYDPNTAAFVPLRYVGSNFTDGVLSSDKPCISGVDNVGFVMGTSSSLFNQAFLQIQTDPEEPEYLRSAISNTLENLGEENRDVAIWPNPFQGFIPGTHEILTLVDGGEDLQNVPLHPLLLKTRKVDAILAIDSSADTSGHWPNGTALVATYHRSVSGFPSNNTAFPPVPDQNSFVNLGLNARPTFFGCNDSSIPLIVYLPNAPYTYNSNVSTFDLEYSDEERDAIVHNGYNVVTMGNGTMDPEWPACLGCAILSRSFDRTGDSPPGICGECFQRYCWDGTVNSTTPPPYNPSLIIMSGSGRSLYPAWDTFRAAGVLYLVYLLIA